MILCAKTKQMAMNTSFINEVLSIQEDTRNLKQIKNVGHINSNHRVQIVPLYFYRISYEGLQDKQWAQPSYLGICCGHG